MALEHLYVVKVELVTNSILVSIPLVLKNYISMIKDIKKI